MLDMYYGTLLGQTSASMFFNNLRTGTASIQSGWYSTMLDTEKSVRRFVSECVAAPELCPLSKVLLDRTAEDIYDDVAKLLITIQESQEAVEGIGYKSMSWELPVVPNTLFGYVKRDIIQSIYSAASFSTLAAKLALALQGDYTVYKAGLAEPLNDYQRGIHAFFGISCSDSSLRAHKPEDLLDMVEKQQASSVFADSWLRRKFGLVQCGNLSPLSDMREVSRLRRKILSSSRTNALIQSPPCHLHRSPMSDVREAHCST